MDGAAARAEQNEAVVRRAYEEGLNGGNAAVADELVAAHFLDNGRPRTPGDVGRALLAVREAFPDWHLTIDDLIATDEQVVVRWTGRGTHRGPYRGVAATGRAVANRGITIWRLAGGKLVERWAAADTLGLLQQLGAVPATGGAAPG